MAKPCNKYITHLEQIRHDPEALEAYLREHLDDEGEIAFWVAFIKSDGCFEFLKAKIEEEGLCPSKPAR